VETQLRAQLIVFLDRFQGEYLSKCHAEGACSYFVAACGHRLIGITGQSSFFLSCSHLWRCIVNWHGNVRARSLHQ
jgi:hypothetical protein